MERLSESHDVEVIWRSFELRPAGSPPMSPEYRARIEANRPRLNAIAREQYGLELNQGPFGIDSRPALIGAKWAEAQQMGAEYHHAIMDAYWSGGRDISDAAVLEEIVGELGLNIDQFRLALEDDTYIAEVDADIRLAQEFGLGSVPAMVFEQKYLVEGAQPYAVLGEVVEKIREQSE